MFLRQYSLSPNVQKVIDVLEAAFREIIIDDTRYKQCNATDRWNLATAVDIAEGFIGGLSACICGLLQLLFIALH